MKYALLTLVCVGMMIFAISAAFMASEEKDERYNR
jgi:hypothetical protein